jgi:hypothetical protein
VSLRAALRRGVVLAAVGAGIAGGLAGCGQAGKFDTDDPRSAVAQLLNAAIGQANGQRACSLLTTAARERLDAGAAGSCRQALNASVSSMPGPYSSTDDAGRATTDLVFDVVSQSRDHAVVTARRGKNPALTFRLVRLTAEQLDEDTAASQDTVGGTVDSDWRVDRGERQLVETDTPAEDVPTTPVAPAAPARSPSTG